MVQWHVRSPLCLIYCEGLFFQIDNLHFFIREKWRNSIAGWSIHPQYFFKVYFCELRLISVFPVCLGVKRIQLSSFPGTPDRIFMKIFTSAELRRCSSSPWKLMLRPAALPASRISRDCCTLNTPSSQNTSILCTCSSPDEVSAWIRGSCSWRTLRVASSGVMSLRLKNKKKIKKIKNGAHQLLPLGRS